MSVANIFARAFEAVEQILVFKEEWSNGTGYFDGAVKGETAPRLQPGVAARFIDNIGRRAIVVGTRFGNVVVFERYANNNIGAFVLNYPTKLGQFRLFDTSGGVGERDMGLLVGGWGSIETENIGFHVERIAKLLEA